MSQSVAERRVVCVIDDDESVRDALQSLLRSHGYRAEAFPSAENFLNSGRAEDAVCLIIDVRMPRMGGLDLQRRLAAAGRRTPIIFISAHEDDDARNRALAAGALAFLRKPFAESTLIEAVRSAVASDGERKKLS